MAGLCLAAAVLAALNDVEPSGHPVADRLASAIFAAVLAWAGARARRWTWCVLAPISLGLASDLLALVAGGGATVLTVRSMGGARPERLVGATVGGLSALALLDARDLGFHGSSALMVAAATAPVLASGYRHASRRTRARIRRMAGAGGLVLAVAAIGYGLAVAGARGPLDQGMRQLDAGVAAAQRGDDALAADRLTAAAEALTAAERELGSWWAVPARAVPVLGHNARAAETLVGTAAALSRQGAHLTMDADTDSLTVDGGRIDLDRIEALHGPLLQVSTSLNVAAQDVEGADTGWLVRPVGGRIDEVRARIADARRDVDVAIDAVKVLPEMLGSGTPSRWFVAFVTPSEARGRTGFLGNYAEVTMSDGHIEMTRFGRAEDLETTGVPAATRTLSGPEDYLARWGRFSPAATWRNVTMSPDFPSVARVITELYPQSGGRPIDGVISVDPTALAALLRFTGPIDVPGLSRPLTEDNAARYLLLDQYIEAPDNETRIDALEVLARRTFERLTTGDLPGPRGLADALGGVVDAGHLHVFSPDPAQRRLLERFRLDGALPPVDGDFLGVVNNNAAGNKVDIFLAREITYDATWDPATGDVAATATVRLTNRAPGEGLPGYIIGNSLSDDGELAPGTNRTYLSLYSPWNLEGASLDGEPVAIEWQEERGRHAGSVFVDVAADTTRTVTFDLRGRLDPGDDYRLTVTGQPLVQPDRFSLSLDVAGPGTIRATSPLTVDGRTLTATTPLNREETEFRLTVDDN